LAGAGPGRRLYEPFARDAAPQLEELRLTALEDRVEADLALGHAADLVAELERLAAAEPGRERLIGQLALALYRSGRQADALATIQRARRWLGTELGLDAGPQLRELERLILQQDDALEAPRRRVAARRRRWAASVAVAMIAIAAVAALIANGGRERTPRPVVVPGTPTALAFGPGAVWAVYSSEDDVARADPRSGAIVDRIDLDDEPGAIGVGAAPSGSRARLAVSCIASTRRPTR
jgi:transcriptional activator